MCILNADGYCQMALQQGHTSLYSRQQWMSVLLGSLNFMYGKHIVELGSISVENSRAVSKPLN